MTKKEKMESNTRYAQGGIACAWTDQDEVDLHIKDTLVAGDGLCERQVVEDILRLGPESIQELITLGVPFCRHKDGSYSLGCEGGHSKERIFHVKDHTGFAIEHTLTDQLLKQPDVEILEHCVALDLITQGDRFSGKRAVGIWVFDTQTDAVEPLMAPVVILASGGLGQLYPYTTNPEVATGDGIAMAYRAGAAVKNLEFIQFHPTALYAPNRDRFLISEATRGEGARLYDIYGAPFMYRYDPRGDLAPRDIVARAIHEQMQQAGSSHVWLDMTHLGKDYILERFPSICAYCVKQGLDITKEWIPVVPAAHYSCGGVEVDIHAQSTLSGLFACGEVACTGLHGANRLASNALLEAVVLAHQGAGKAMEWIKRLKGQCPQVAVAPPGHPSWNLRGPKDGRLCNAFKEQIKQTMWEHVGLIRREETLLVAKKAIKEVSEQITESLKRYPLEAQWIEVRNMAEVAGLVIESALMRKESRGLHYSSNYSKRSAEVKNTVLIRHDT